MPPAVYTRTQSLWCLQQMPGGGARRSQNRPRPPEDFMAGAAFPYQRERLPTRSGKPTTALSPIYCAFAVRHLARRVPMLPDEAMEGLMEPVTLTQ